MTDLYSHFKNEQLKQRREDQDAFLADLVLVILEDMKSPRPWFKVAELAVFEYERKRDQYLDDPVVSDLIVPDDSWIKPSRIASTSGKRRIESAVIDRGWYIARPIGKGILLTKDKVTITDDHEKDERVIKSRTERMNFNTSIVNEKLKTELRMASLQFLKSGD